MSQLTTNDIKTVHELPEITPEEFADEDSMLTFDLDENAHKKLKVKNFRDWLEQNQAGAAESETRAKASAEAAAISEASAKASEEALAGAEASAKASAEAAAISEANAKASEEAAAQSEASAKASEEASATSEANAKASEEAAATSEANAKASAEAAATSEANAKSSAEAAALSEENAKASEEAAAQSAESAAESAERAEAAMAGAEAAVASTEFSSEETVVGKWIDGKPIYRKTLESSGRIVPVAGSNSILCIDIAPVGVDLLVGAKVVFSNLAAHSPTANQAGFQICSGAWAGAAATAEGMWQHSICRRMYGSSTTPPAWANGSRDFLEVRAGTYNYSTTLYAFGAIIEYTKRSDPAG